MSFVHFVLLSLSIKFFARFFCVSVFVKIISEEKFLLFSFLTAYLFRFSCKEKQNINWLWGFYYVGCTKIGSP